MARGWQNSQQSSLLWLKLSRWFQTDNRLRLPTVLQRHPTLLPREARISRFFTRTGRKLTEVANPSATTSVIYANSDSSKKVTITVDGCRQRAMRRRPIRSCGEEKSCSGLRGNSRRQSRRERVHRNGYAGRRPTSALAHYTACWSLEQLWQGTIPHQKTQPSSSA